MHFIYWDQLNLTLHKASTEVAITKKQNVLSGKNKKRQSSLFGGKETRQKRDD